MLMPRKTGSLRREQQPAVRPQVAGLIRADARERRKARRAAAALHDRRTVADPTDSIIALTNDLLNR